MMKTHQTTFVPPKAYFSPPGYKTHAWWVICSVSVSYLFIYLCFNYSCYDQLSQNLPERSSPNFHGWWNCGSSVDIQPEISFEIPQGTLPWQPFFVSFIYRTDFRG